MHDTPLSAAGARLRITFDEPIESSLYPTRRMTHLGLIGLGTMGANLARNAARNGHAVSVFNRTAEKMDAFMKDYGREGKFVPTRTLREFVGSLPVPRVILLMVKAGDAVDGMIAELKPLLASGDILMDAGNSHFRDTERRQGELALLGIKFIGMGVSGGEEGALNGPSIMPGGDREACMTLMPLLTSMAASDREGGACVTYVGPGGAGHYVKMVHNGIEYGVMQLIAEVYHLLRAAGETPASLARVFDRWAQEQQSFLLEITAEILKTADPETGQPIVDVIRDIAGQKGTGRWAVEEALLAGVAIPTIDAAVQQRVLSADAELRSRLAGGLPHPGAQKIELNADDARDALELATAVCAEQGFVMMRRMSEEKGWNLDLAEIARIWRGGCIIRMRLLKDIQDAIQQKHATAAKLSERFTPERQVRWRYAVTQAVSAGIPVPALASTVAYYDSLAIGSLPINLIQAQRDFFGAHGFIRVDREGESHGPWHQH